MWCRAYRRGQVDRWRKGCPLMVIASRRDGRPVCFSAQADLIGGATLAAIGFDAVRHVHRRHDHIAFAALPLLLALHEFDEAFVWWGIEGHVSAWVGRVAMWVYLLFALVMLPVYLPLAIRALEPPGRQRRAMTAFASLGGVVAGLLLVGMIRGPVTATLGEFRLVYGIHVHAGLLIVASYVVATCGSAMFSSHRRIAIFGTVNLIAVALLAQMAIDGFASLWCAWAAVAGAAIAVHLRIGGHQTVTHALA
jgi:hypothetical protein